MMRILFICNQNENRSRTAEELFRGKYETRSAGLDNLAPVTERQIEWADTVIVMEDEQRTELGTRFPSVYLKKRILSLDIPDIYAYMEPELISLLKERFTLARN
jgi:predicted protein tyrosine phosphatase